MMYYRKKFVGTIETKQTGTISEIGSTTLNLSLTDVISQAVVDTLNIGGIVSIYNVEEHYMMVDGMKMFLYYQNYTSTSAGKWNLFVGGRVVATPSSSYQPFSNTYPQNYNFFVTVKGDPSSGMHVYISQNLTANLESEGFDIVRGKDLYNDKDVVFFSLSDNLEDYYVRDIEGKDYGNFGTTQVSFEKTSLASNTVYRYLGDEEKNFNALWKKRDESGYFMMNAYVMTSNKPSGHFFNFDNKLYMYFNSYTIVECGTLMATI